MFCVNFRIYTFFLWELNLIEEHEIEASLRKRFNESENIHRITIRFSLFWLS